MTWPDALKIQKAGQDDKQSQPYVGIALHECMIQLTRACTASDTRPGPSASILVFEYAQPGPDSARYLLKWDGDTDLYRQALVKEDDIPQYALRDLIACSDAPKPVVHSLSLPGDPCVEIKTSRHCLVLCSLHECILGIQS